ncbi:hypothetical protein [Acidicapsa ligni]|uniref:hypothetical protein n=1 Tax=Acidicapsa ligni TaxID=542300 RepID=UPI0021E096E9|nr:hypothetical protein [Acidicapsa ligni]
MRPFVFGFDQQAKKGSAHAAGLFLCVEMSMSKGPFLPSEFVPTKFSTSADKAMFGNALLHFIESEWNETLFTKKFYNQLCNTFGHIAHYNRATFYSTWFTCDADRVRFLEQTLEWPCWGEAEFTFCDVERALQREVRKRNYLGRYELRAAESLRAAEMAILKRLEAKYRPAADPRAAESPGPENPAPSPSPIHPEPTSLVQGSLF